MDGNGQPSWTRNDCNKVRMRCEIKVNSGISKGEP